MDLHCFDSFTTNRVEGENQVLKRAETGAHAGCSTAQLIYVVQFLDQRRATKRQAEHFRAAVSCPLVRQKLFQELYSVLPVQPLRKLEEQYKLRENHVLLSVNLEQSSLTMTGSMNGRYGLGPRIRTITLDPENNQLNCDCNFWQR